MKGIPGLVDRPLDRVIGVARTCSLRYAMADHPLRVRILTLIQESRAAPEPEALTRPAWDGTGISPSGSTATVV